jgi:glyoxylase-like metal-dependent hydrolase (beta-lactamase superfamily II)
MRIEVLGPDGGIPYLPGWRGVHTPGHVSFYRADDGVLITGDALITLQVNTLVGMVRGRQGVSDPPWYTTADAASARASIADLAPRVLASGHGHPLVGPDTADRVHDFADAF